MNIAVTGVVIGGILFDPITWEDAASHRHMEVFEPHYLPHNSGKADIGDYGGEDGYEEVYVTYPGGLYIVESNRKLSEDACAEAVNVPGAEEGCFGIAKAPGSDIPELRFPKGGRALTFRKGGTWVQLAGASDRELIQVAESLRLAPHHPRGGAG